MIFHTYCQVHQYYSTNGDLCPQCINLPKPMPPGYREVYRCPVCEGNGMRPFDFYGTMSIGPAGAVNNANLPVRCRSCDGKGIIWR